MSRQCRCHGVSGSCTVKSCWNTVPDFLVVGDYLKRKYLQSVEVINRPTKRRLRRKDRSLRKDPVAQDDLVHLERSPNYCVRNPAKGIMGTSGRECNRTSSGADSCDLLCCGRGYNTQEVRLVERCDCKFIWCCEVKCRVCETVTDVFTCKWVYFCVCLPRTHPERNHSQISLRKWHRHFNLRISLCATCSVSCKPVVSHGQAAAPSVCHDSKLIINMN